jgi:hypothetical protein
MADGHAPEPGIKSPMVTGNVFAFFSLTVRTLFKRVCWSKQQ